MVNVNVFINSIKTSWIRRLYNGNNDWCILFHDMHRDLGDVFSKSMHYITSYICTMKNAFWADVLAAWVNLNTNMAIKNPADFLSQRVWNNDLFQMDGHPVHIPALCNQKFYFVNDFFDEEGNFYDYETIKDYFGVNVDFLTFFGLRRAILSVNDNFKISSKLPMPIRPPIYSVLLRSDKGCQVFYDIIVKPYVTSNTYSKEKWNSILNVSITDEIWKYYNKLVFKGITSVPLKWFQYRIVNSFLCTNVLLHRIGLKENDLCTFCKQEKETILHLFCMCPVVKNLIDQFNSWTREKLSKIFYYSNECLLLGYHGYGTDIRALNYLAVIFKYHVYKCRLKSVRPTLSSFLCDLREYLKVEKYVSGINCNYTHFLEMWSEWENAIRMESLS